MANISRSIREIAGITGLGREGVETVFNKYSVEESSITPEIVKEWKGNPPESAVKLFSEEFDFDISLLSRCLQYVPMVDVSTILEVYKGDRFAAMDEVKDVATAKRKGYIEYSTSIDDGYIYDKPAMGYLSLYKAGRFCRKHYNMSVNETWKNNEENLPAISHIFDTMGEDEIIRVSIFGDDIHGNTVSFESAINKVSPDFIVEKFGAVPFLETPPLVSTEFSLMVQSVIEGQGDEQDTVKVAVWRVSHGIFIGATKKEVESIVNLSDLDGKAKIEIVEPDTFENKPIEGGIHIFTEEDKKNRLTSHREGR